MTYKQYRQLKKLRDDARIIAELCRNRGNQEAVIEQMTAAKSFEIAANVMGRPLPEWKPKRQK